MDALAYDNQGNARMAYNFEEGLPWHNLGTGVKGFMTATQVAEESKLNWTTLKRPVYNANGNEIPGFFQTYFHENDGSTHHLGVVKSRWEPVQNLELFKMLDKTVGEGNAVWDTAGALFDCTKVFGALKINEIPGLDLTMHNGEKLDPYLVVLNSHDGSWAVRVFNTIIRPVCHNTVSAGWRDASKKNRMWATRHTTKVNDRIPEIRKFFGMHFDLLKTMMEESNRLEATPTTDTIVAHFLSELWPIEKDTRQADIRKRTGYRNRVLELAHTGPGNDRDRMNNWFLFNGLTQFLDHEYSVPETEIQGERRMTSILEGSRAQKREKGKKLLLAYAN